MEREKVYKITAVRYSAPVSGPENNTNLGEGAEALLKATQLFASTAGHDPFNTGMIRCTIESDIGERSPEIAIISFTDGEIFLTVPA